MTAILYRRINRIRNPFTVLQLPVMGRLCRYWLDNVRIKGRKRSAKLARGCYVYLSRCGIPSRGLLEYRRNGQHHEIPFDARNTQFSSLYLRRYGTAYEAEIAAMLDLLVPPAGVFFDVGANFGYFSLYLASRPNFSGRIHAFEPHPDSFGDLQRMVRGARLEDVLHLHPLAAYHREDTMLVRPSNVRSGNFTLRDASQDPRISHLVRLARLDSLACPPPDVIKIDTDGSETEVLDGCAGFLHAKQPHIIFESTAWMSDARRSMGPFQLLNRLGYAFYYIGWLDLDAGTGFAAIRNEEEVPDGARKNLCIYPFDFEARFLFGERLNILAVHRSRLPGIKELFTAYERKTG